MFWSEQDLKIVPKLGWPSIFRKKNQDIWNFEIYFDNFLWFLYCLKKGHFFWKPGHFSKNRDCLGKSLADGHPSIRKCNSQKEYQAVGGFSELFLKNPSKLKNFPFWDKSPKSPPWLCTCSYHIKLSLPFMISEYIY